MEDGELEIMRRFPLLCQEESGKYWSGFISFEGTLIRIVIKAPNYPSAEDAVIEGDQDTWNFFHLHQQEIEKMLKQPKTTDSSFFNLLVNLQKLVEKIVGEQESLDVRDPLFYSGLLVELEEIKLENVSYLSKDYCEIHIDYKESCGRQHSMQCKLPNRYPYVGMKVFVDIPNSESISWPNKVLEAHQQFVKLINMYSPFFEEMDEIDSNSNVLDPLNPNKSTTHRRILISENVIMLIVLDPDNPRGYPPELKFTGPEKLLEVFEKLVEDNCNKWDSSKSVLENLEEILEQKIPPKVEAELISEDKFCPICYQYAFDGEIPEIRCECGCSYHNQCLNELFKTEMSSKMKKSRTVKCPNCSMELKIKAFTKRT